MGSATADGVRAAGAKYTSRHRRFRVAEVSGRDSAGNIISLEHLRRGRGAELCATMHGCVGEAGSAAAVGQPGGSGKMPKAGGRRQRARARGQMAGWQVGSGRECREAGGRLG